MYPQIRVHEKDQKSTRILWRDSAGIVAAFQMTGVTFGLALSSFVATRALTYLAKLSNTEENTKKP
jgi:hypothetical protein